MTTKRLRIAAPMRHGQFVVETIRHLPARLASESPVSQAAMTAWEARVSELVAENETLTEYVQRLEEAAPQGQPMPLVSGDSLAAELERFLRERDGGREGSS